uniref:SCP domain-containing protein n=1 Tax=Mola mola TaxID=94237 RepID=A0A3Q3WKX5_MOLML
KGQRVVKALVWAWIIQNSVCSVSLPEITDRKFIDQCVREHNAARSSVSPAASNMLYMTWDAGLASTAKAWARQCLFEHNPRLQEDSRRNPTSSVGENIWTGYPPSYFDVTHAIKKWVNEVQDYDYNSNNCRAVCGHYTQVVWASTYKVGCAAQLCPDGVKKTNFADKEGVVFVCNYGPGGNLVGTKPYKSKGEACSGCEGGYTCMKNLCVVFHFVLPGYRTPDLETAITASDLNYPVILIIRPLALVCTGMAAYAVHRYYPNVFCYE